MFFFASDSLKIKVIELLGVSVKRNASDERGARSGEAYWAEKCVTADYASRN